MIQKTTSLSSYKQPKNRKKLAGQIFVAHHIVISMVQKSSQYCWLGAAWQSNEDIELEIRRPGPLSLLPLAGVH